MSNILKVVFIVFLAFDLILSGVTAFYAYAVATRVDVIDGDLLKLRDEIRQGQEVPSEDEQTTPEDGQAEEGQDEESSDEETIQVKLFYKNKKEDPSILDCNADGYVYREIPDTTTPLTDTLKLLLVNELTATEEKTYTTGFDDTNPTAKAKFKVKSVSINNGVASITLEDPLGFTTGGSCRVSMMRDQIVETAKQFPTVKSVVIFPDTLFQP